MDLYASWSDKDTITALGTAIAGLVIAVSVLVVRYLSAKGKNNALEGEHEEVSGSRTFREMKQLLQLQTRRIEELEEKVETKLASIQQLQQQEAACQARLATLTEQNRWMKSILKKNGLLSAQDEQEFPRANSDEVRKPEGMP